VAAASAVEDVDVVEDADAVVIAMLVALEVEPLVAGEPLVEEVVEDMVADSAARRGLVALELLPLADLLVDLTPSNRRGIKPFHSNKSFLPSDRVQFFTYLHFFVSTLLFDIYTSRARQLHLLLMDDYRRHKSNASLPPKRRAI
jgi:hypothetical protein